MKHILVVDDNKTNLAVAKSELSKNYQVTPVISGHQALQFLEKRKTDLILLDINMPEMDGRETMRCIRERKEWASIPIIFLTADSSPETEAQCLSDGADDFIAKPFVPQVMQSRVGRILELAELRSNLEMKLAEKTKQVEQITLNAIMAIANTIEAKDRYTRGHSNRVARYCVEIATRLGMSEEEIKALNFMALLHDIGKIGVPDEILNKPMPLDDDDFEIVKMHPAIGSEILKDLTSMPNMHIGALCHHERYDGKGYPSGLKGEEIPIEARMIAIADSYDAMSSNRAYREALPREQVLDELRKGRGTQFDPSVLDVFLDMLDKNFFD
ncbi:MAG: response regulator [Lachnospiraceae bacterium]|nr:response regulator [Lachnospiraceae bacterium]